MSHRTDFLFVTLAIADWYRHTHSHALNNVVSLISNPRLLFNCCSLPRQVSKVVKLSFLPAPCCVGLLICNCPDCLSSPICGIFTAIIYTAFSCVCLQIIRALHLRLLVVAGHPAGSLMPDRLYSHSNIPLCVYSRGQGPE